MRENDVYGELMYVDKLTFSICDDASEISSVRATLHPCTLRLCGTRSLQRTRKRTRKRTKKRTKKRTRKRVRRVRGEGR